MSTRRSFPAALVVFVVGCQGPAVDNGVDDASTPFDSAGSEVGVDSIADAPVEVSDASPKLAGQACSRDDDCKSSGVTGAYCLTWAPTPVCYGGTCGPPVTGDPNVVPCGVDGVCLDDGASHGVCVPMCLFDGKSSSFSIGCAGKNLCEWVGRTVRDGVGYAYGRCEPGCGSDSDCPTGQRCQIENGSCQATPTTFTGAIGDACAASDTKCACVYGLDTKLGYCSRVCRFGETACPTGFSCDPDVPITFPILPSRGMYGNCLKDCNVDDDCASVNGFCDLHAALGHKTCQPGKRP